MPVQEVDQAGDGGSDHVVRKRPEIALGPDFRDRLAFSQPDDRRHGCAVEGEVSHRRDQQSEGSGTMKNVSCHQLVCAICGCAGNRHLRQIEDELNKLGATCGPPIELSQGAGQPDQQGLGHTQFQNS